MANNEKKWLFIIYSSLYQFSCTSALQSSIHKVHSHQLAKMTRITKMGRRTHLEATPYDRPEPSQPPSTKRTALPSQHDMEVSLGFKKARSENRRQKREQDRNAGKVCFNCRQEGHRAQSCPENKTEGGKSQKQICYRCGKSDHSLKQCRSNPSKGLQFAQCFVCKEKGHITSNCPTNGNGVYPDGGSCKICRSVEHLAKNCPIPEEIRLGAVIGTQASDRHLGADDDDFHDVAKVEVKRGKSSIKTTSKNSKRVVVF